jgi:hypothetical protein
VKAAGSSQALAISAGSVSYEAISVDVEPGWTGSVVGVDYSTLPGCLPEKFGHRLGLWQGSGVNWMLMPPPSGAPVDVDQEQGSVVLEKLQISNLAYTVAYAVGSAPTDYCASVTFGPGHMTKVNGVSLTVNFLGPTSLSLHFVTMPGNDPSAAPNWVGLWKGIPAIYTNKPPPLARVTVSSESNEDDVAFNNVPMTIGTTYTAVYFMGAAPTTAAALLTFTTTSATAEPIPTSQLERTIKWSLQPAAPRIS